MDDKAQRVFITGGAGYVGAVLVPKLVRAGYGVTNLDLYLYGDDVLKEVKGNPRLREVKGDLRDRELLRREMAGHDAVIHLACISNDPSYELNPDLGRSINHEGTRAVVEEAKRAGANRFIYASSSSVYGVRPEERVTEELEPAPLTDYSKFKVVGEKICLELANDRFTVCCIRPATVCGFSPRLRLDVVVNILTHLAIVNRKISVFGGDQYRPNIHIEDMTDLYEQLLREPRARIRRAVWNAGHVNHTVDEIASIVQEVVGPDVQVDRKSVGDDPRSYRVDSSKIDRDIGFKPKRSVRDAVADLKRAFTEGRVPNSMTDTRYYNIRRMKERGLI